MIEAVNKAAQTLDSALAAMELYPQDHPAVAEEYEKAHSLFLEVLQELAEVILVGFEDRVVFQNQTLPSGQHLAQGLFQRLRDGGVECVTFRRGINAAELRSLLTPLKKTAAGDEPLSSTPHIQLGFLQDVPEAADGLKSNPSEDGAVSSGEVRRQIDTVEGIWNGVIANEACDDEALGLVAQNLCHAVSLNRGSMVPLIEVKQHDEYTFVHTLNVAVLSAAMAEAVGLGPGLVHDLTLAALLHDVGKRLVPKQLLNKPGKLTDEEFATVRRHPVDGARLLLGARGVPDLAPIVAYEHHMHLDGSGYPAPHGGRKLHLASQLVQLPDVFDALSTDRPYRAALPLEKSVAILQEGVGTMFDRELLEVFVERVARRSKREASRADLTGQEAA